MKKIFILFMGIVFPLIILAQAKGGSIIFFGNLTSFNDSLLPNQEIDSTTNQRVQNSILRIITNSEYGTLETTGIILDHLTKNNTKFTLCVSCFHNFLIDSMYFTPSLAHIAIIYKGKYFRDHYPIYTFKNYDIFFFITRGWIGEPIHTDSISTPYVCGFDFNNQRVKGIKTNQYGLRIPSVQDSSFQKNNSLKTVEIVRMTSFPGFSGGPLTDYKGNFDGLIIGGDYYTSNLFSYVIPKSIILSLAKQIFP